MNFVLSKHKVNYCW